MKDFSGEVNIFTSSNFSLNRWKEQAVSSLGDTISSIDRGISSWFWNLINDLPHDYFAKIFDQVDYCDKRIWEGIFRARVEELKEQPTSGILEEVFEANIIRLQGLVGKHSLSPVTYEGGLSELESHAHNLNNSEKYLDILEKVRCEFREELRSQPLLLKECIQSAEQNEIDYYKSLLDTEIYPTTEKVIHNNDLSLAYSKKSSSTFSKIRNLSKFILGNPAQAVTMFLAAQVVYTSAIAINNSIIPMTIDNPIQPIYLDKVNFYLH